MIQPSNNQPQPRSQVGLLIAIVVLSVAAGLAVVLLELFHAGDNTPIIIQIVGFFGVTVAALLAFMRSDQNAGALRDLHGNINGRLDQLLESTRALGHAAGRIEGHAAGLADAADKLASQGPKL